MTTRIRSGSGLATRVLLVAVFTLVASACGMNQGSKTEGKAQMSTRPIEDVLADHTESLMARAGVVGTYQGLTDDGRSCIKVMVTELTRELEESIPEQLEGYPVVIEVTGEIRGLPDGGE